MIMYILIVLVIAAFWGLYCIVHRYDTINLIPKSSGKSSDPLAGKVRRSDTINPIPESSGKSSDPLAGKVYYRGVTHEDVLAAMDENILAYVDSSLPQYRCEYSRTKARLMGKSDDLLEKNARKVENLMSQIHDLEKWMDDLKTFKILKFDQAVTKRKTTFAKFFKSKMSRGVCHCISRSNFDVCHLKPYLRERYKDYTEDQIDHEVDHEVKVLQNEFENKLESCIKSLKSKLDCKKFELEIYKARV